ncbi:MAG: RsmB/NOP family class I SAM-dependent RNA methyltransferase [Sphingomonadaceae bacterium]|nr:RsmB/NOP family class I SAM-dependent RNA methyltransferase [Sphingomonadaceae bacterium]
MTPAARVQAAIECLDLIAAAASEGGAAADTLIARYFAARRYAGSKDRRAVRDLVFDVVRQVGEPPPSGRAALIGYARAAAPDLLETFGESGHAPAPLLPDEPAAEPSPAPAWLLDRLRARFGDDTPRQVAALLGRAPLDLRVNTLKGRRDAVAVAEAVPTPFARDGLRLPTAANVERSDAFRDGLIEVQDEGSQLAVATCAVEPGMTVVDLCAGAGGKTLALAAAMANRGRLIASDTDRGRLQRMVPRLARAGVTIAAPRLLDARREAEALADLASTADLVLIDAPCSGTGTWRRNPEARWRLTPERLARLTAEQARLLDLAAVLVRGGGALAYVVCSLLPEEAEAQVAAFRTRRPGFEPQDFANPLGGAAVSTLVLTPGDQGCDGFFIARLTRVC